MGGNLSLYTNCAQRSSWKKGNTTGLTGGLSVFLCFCVSSVDRAVCKTKGQAPTNPRLVANMLSYNTVPFLFLSHRHTHTKALLLTTLPACASLTSTARNKSDKLKKK